MKGTGPKLIYIVLIITAVVIYLSSTNIKSILKLREEITSYEQKLSMLKKKNSEMLQEVEWIRTRDDYVKFLAKKRLGLVEPGEIKYYLVTKDD
ncbi:MAG: septum formation initiator family protein [Elusimicrobia bacterium]|nr:septum formation initiator family protein [Elusimicrobiota bacterium]